MLKPVHLLSGSIMQLQRSLARTARCTLSLPDGFTLRIRQMPTISPRDGLPMTVAPRSALDRTADSAASAVPVPA